MTLVNADTGEIVAQMTPAEARDLTDRIRTSLLDITPDVLRAYEGQAWAALGFDTWDAYCEAEFASVRLQLPRAKREETVQALRDGGMSVRAIAAATGASKSTVADDLSRVQNRTPEQTSAAPDDTPRAPIKGVDGKTYRQPSKRDVMEKLCEDIDPALAMRVKFAKVMAAYYERLTPFDMGEVVDAFASDADERRRIADFMKSLRRTADVIDAGLARNQRIRSVK